MAFKIKEGRARLNLKIWTSTMSTDMTGCHMSEAAAQDIYRVALSGKNEAQGVIEALVKELGDAHAAVCQERHADYAEPQALLDGRAYLESRK